MSDSKLFQKIQDYFCMVNGIYLSCLTKKDGVMTENDLLEIAFNDIGVDGLKKFILNMED